MWRLSTTTSIILINLVLSTVQTEYTITTSNEVGSYNYPAPPKYQQLHDPVVSPYNNAAPQVYHNQYKSNYPAPAFLQQQSAVVARQFSSHALDNAAFNIALTNQGYTYDNIPAFNAALRTRSRPSKTTFRTASTTSSSSSPSSSSSFSPVIGSLNVKLPLPIGITPINIAPLPLQAGAPYAAIPNPVTSYGTVYPQRKRRHS